MQVEGIGTQGQTAQTGGSQPIRRQQDLTGISRLRQCVAEMQTGQPLCQCRPGGFHDDGPGHFRMGVVRKDAARYRFRRFATTVSVQFHYQTTATDRAVTALHEQLPGGYHAFARSEQNTPTG